MRVLIVYGTTEGQTRKISERIGERIRELGHDAALQDSASLPADLDVGAYDAVIAAASVHQHRFQASLVHFVKERLEQLQAKPTAFVSVSLSTVLEGNQQEAQGYVDQFLAETGWHPTRTELVAGALVYTRYDFFKRQIMKLIVWRGGGPTDASQDFEFTDWDALSRFVDSFIVTANS
jgi:menaquinone-dependent protoporphyrinogen oxidase